MPRGAREGPVERMSALGSHRPPNEGAHLGAQEHRCDRKPLTFRQRQGQDDIIERTLEGSRPSQECLCLARRAAEGVRMGKRNASYMPSGAIYRSHEDDCAFYVLHQVQAAETTRHVQRCSKSATIEQAARLWWLGLGAERLQGYVPGPALRLYGHPSQRYQEQNNCASSRRSLCSRSSTAMCLAGWQRPRRCPGPASRNEDRPWSLQDG